MLWFKKRDCGGSVFAGVRGRLAPRRVQGGALPPEAFSFPFLAAFARES